LRRIEISMSATTARSAFWDSVQTHLLVYHCYLPADGSIAVLYLLRVYSCSEADSSEVSASDGSEIVVGEMIARAGFGFVWRVGASEIN
jgi:hypothetical protein